MENIWNVIRPIMALKDGVTLNEATIRKYKNVVNSLSSLKKNLKENLKIDQLNLDLSTNLQNHLDNPLLQNFLRSYWGELHHKKHRLSDF